MIFGGDPFSHHPLGYIEHGHFPTLPLEYVPTELDDATALATAEVFVDILRQAHAYEKVSQEEKSLHWQKNALFLLTVSSLGRCNQIGLKL